MRHDEMSNLQRIPPRGIPNMKFPRRNGGGGGNFYKWLPVGDPVRWFCVGLFMDCWGRTNILAHRTIYMTFDWKNKTFRHPYVKKKKTIGRV